MMLSKLLTNSPAAITSCLASFSSTFIPVALQDSVITFGLCQSGWKPCSISHCESYNVFVKHNSLEIGLRGQTQNSGRETCLRSGGLCARRNTQFAKRLEISGTSSPAQFRGQNR
eukprot:scpid101624/ scgid18655/ 